MTNEPKARQVTRGSNLTMTTYRSVADMNDLILKNLSKLPRDLGLVVGVPRSGLLVANLVALYLNLPLTDLQGLQEGRLIKSGHRKLRCIATSGRTKALVVDDCVGRGTQIREIRQSLEPLGERFQLVYAVPYCTPGYEHLVDFAFELIPLRRVFQWNVVHNHILEKTCVEIDALLKMCAASPMTDEPASFASAPALTPTYSIGRLITRQPQGSVEGIVSWLKRHSVKYDELVVLNDQRGQPLSVDAYAGEKAKVYGETGAYLAIESTLHDSVALARAAGKPVFCMERQDMIYPSWAARAGFISRYGPRALVKILVRR